MGWGKKKEPSMNQDQIEQALDEELERGPSGIKDHYVHAQKTMDELRNAKQGLDKKKNIRGVRKAVEASEGHEIGSERFIYKTSDKVRTSADKNERTTSLHGGLGTRLADKGEYVFQVSIAGSTYNEFRKMHHHAPGKSAFIGNAAQNDKNTNLNQEEKKEGFTATEAQKGKIRRLLDKLYGKRIIRDGKEDKYIRRKDINGKVKYYLPGPGNFDKDDPTRSVDALRHNTLDFAKEYLTDIFSKFKSGQEQPKNINLLLQGHSRGGVAIGESMQMIQSWVNKEYPEYEKFVKYDLLQLDPVPGSDTKSKHEELDLNAETVTDKLNTAERANTKFKDNVRSTVMYSMNVNEDFMHKMFFDPQAVHGANRVILCPMSHTLQLASVDATQEGGLSKASFTFAGNGEQYRGSGINELPDGVYIMDETATMVKIKSPKQLESIMSTVFGRAEIGQGYRRETLQKVADKWFEAHPTPMEKRLEIVNRDMGSAMDRLLNIPEGSSLRKAGESALEGRATLASLATREKLTDADRALAAQCISKMVLFEIASRSPNPEKISANFEKLAKELQKSDEITTFTNGCTSEDLVGFFDRAGEKAFCKNLQIMNNKLKKQKEPSKEKKAPEHSMERRSSVTSVKSGGAVI